MERNPPDFGLFMIVLMLLALGLVMIYSASASFSDARYGQPQYLLMRQLVHILIGLGAVLVLMHFDYRNLRTIATLLLLATIGLTGLSLISQVGRSLGTGASRWLEFGPISFQPTEILKLGLVLFMATSLARKGKRLGKLTEGMLPYLMIMGIIILLVLGQPDFGMAMFLGMIGIVMMFAGGIPTRQLSALLLAGLPFVYALIFYSPYRQQRILAFLDPLQYGNEGGYHIIQSLVAVGSGGAFGRGLGASREIFYLPAGYNDFIFALISEELGLIGGGVVVVLFGLLGYRGMRIALRAPDRFGGLLAFGLTFALVFQAALHIGVTIGILPVTGLTLPFISYGGSSLIVSLAMIGVLLNISRATGRSEPSWKRERRGRGGREHPRVGRRHRRSPLSRNRDHRQA
ncbi:MAG: putative lipid II flippase FtsW [Candidatus Bipolaricaulia bacterium]